MVLLQTGHLILSGISDGKVKFILAGSRRPVGARLARLRMSNKIEPSTRITLRPLANSVAPFVNTPEVTTKPPAAPPAAMTPYSSRTTSTPTLNARHCLHCTKNFSPPLRNFIFVVLRSAKILILYLSATLECKTHRERRCCCFTRLI